MEINYVYWYKLPNHKDINKDGYVGVTNNLNRRHLEHMGNSNNLQDHFQNAINKYGKDNIEKIIVFSGTREESYDIESFYRPEKNIGWNFSKGGDDTIGERRKTPISMYHKDSYPILQTFKSSTEASRVLNISIGRVSQAKHRKREVYGKDGWAILYDTTYDRTATKTYTELISMALRGKKKTKDSIFKGMTNRWTNEQLKAISKVHKGKTISEEQKKLTRLKHQATHPSCKQILMFHKDNYVKLYSYHSISEASRQLNIPLSRLKSKNLRKSTSYGEDGWAILFDKSFDRSTTLTGRKLAGKNHSKRIKKEKQITIT